MEIEKLIAKYLVGCLSKEEDQTLKKWLQEDESHPAQDYNMLPFRLLLRLPNTPKTSQTDQPVPTVHLSKAALSFPFPVFRQPDRH